MKKEDGRKNNGGWRPGAGRKPSAAKQLALEADRLFGEAAMDGYTIVPRKVGRQTRWVKKSRFDVLLEEYVRLGLIFKKGYRREFTKFCTLALETDDPEVYEYRLSRIEYEVNQAKKARGSEQTKEVQPKDPALVMYEEQVKKGEELAEIIRHQNERNSRAIDSYERNKEIHRKHFGQ